MKILSCASYYGSGSSAITDLLSECDCCASLTNYEFRFVQDPDGISELEYNLIDNFNRLNSGHAIKRYKKLVDYYGNHLFVKRYEPFFNNKWKEISYDYIDSLVSFKYKGIWQYDFYDKGRVYEFIAKLPDRVLNRTIWKNKPDKHCFFGNNEMYCSYMSENDFLQKTIHYTDMLFNEANRTNKDYLIVDQLVPSTNLKRHLRYFSDINVFIVDRDPRDIYLLAKYEWHDEIVPKDIDLFCKWYKYSRSTKDIEAKENQVMCIQFEDMIYDYDRTVKRIFDWIGIDESSHKLKRKIFNPDLSKKNTQYWKSHPECIEEADQIAEKLPNYLYDYEK